MAFMDALGIESAIIVGHSMGSAVAMRMAMNYPERVQGLVLASAIFTPLRNNPDIVEFWDAAVSSIEDPVDPEFVREFQVSTLAQPVPPAFLDTIVSESLKVLARVWRAALQGTMAADVTGELEKIRAPTLIIWGDQDGMVPRNDGEALEAGIAGSRLVIYPDTGHGVHWEEAERFASDLTAFCQSFRG